MTPSGIVCFDVINNPSNNFYQRGEQILHPIFDNKTTLDSRSCATSFGVIECEFGSEESRKTKIFFIPLLFEVINKIFFPFFHALLHVCSVVWLRLLMCNPKRYSRSWTFVCVAKLSLLSRQHHCIRNAICPSMERCDFYKWVKEERKEGKKMVKES